MIYYGHSTGAAGTSSQGVSLGVWSGNGVWDVLQSASTALLGPKLEET